MSAQQTFADILETAGRMAEAEGWRAVTALLCYWSAPTAKPESLPQTAKGGLESFVPYDTTDSDDPDIAQKTADLHTRRYAGDVTRPSLSWWPTSLRIPAAARRPPPIPAAHTSQPSVSARERPGVAGSS